MCAILLMRKLISAEFSFQLHKLVWLKLQKKLLENLFVKKNKCQIGREDLLDFLNSIMVLSMLMCLSILFRYFQKKAKKKIFLLKIKFILLIIDIIVHLQMRIQMMILNHFQKEIGLKEHFNLLIKRRISTKIKLKILFLVIILHLQ